MGKLLNWQRITTIINLPRNLRLAWNLFWDSRVPKVSKFVCLGGILLYFLSPIDIIPELILPGLGQLDDIAVIIFFINRFLNSIPEYIVRDYR